MNITICNGITKNLLVAYFTWSFNGSHNVEYQCLCVYEQTEIGA